MPGKKLSLNEYRERLVVRYSQELLDDFDKVFTGEMILSKISNKYGFSKMRASQLFTRLYGKSFTKTKRDGGARRKVMNIAENPVRAVMVQIPMEDYTRLKMYGEATSTTMSAIIRMSLVDFMNKNRWARAAKIF